MAASPQLDGCPPEAESTESSPSRRSSLSALVRSAVDKSVASVTEALGVLKERLVRFDKEAGLSEKSSEFMAPHLARAQEATAAIAAVAGSLRTSAEVPVRKMTEAVARTSAAYAMLRERAIEFDTKHKVGDRLRKIVVEQDIRAYLTTAATAVTQASEDAHARLQGVTDALKAQVRSRVESLTDMGQRRVEQLKDTVKDTASTVTTTVKDTAVGLDQKYQITEKATAAAKAAATQANKKAAELDERFSISQEVGGAVAQAQALDEKYKVSANIAKVGEQGKQLDDQYTNGKVYEAWLYGRGLADNLLASAMGALSSLNGKEADPADAAPADAAPADAAPADAQADAK